MKRKYKVERCVECGGLLRFYGNKVDGYYYGCLNFDCKRQRVSRRMRTKQAALDDYHT